MQVKATTQHGIEVALSERDQADLARIFELGVNVAPNTYQEIVVSIATPGYDEEEVNA